MKKTLRIGMCLWMAINLLPLAGHAVAADSAVSAVQAAPVIAEPTGLKAEAGNNETALMWNAVTGAVYYNVKRSTVNGGPYVTIAGHVAGTSYTDALPRLAAPFITTS
ncbi:hypothetical protein LJK88_17460 [Paenibacillus sp. P26]|nr:hypothetical protein LJK88_17460 [Paenibacillus sp. P26]